MNWDSHITVSSRDFLFIFYFFASVCRFSCVRMCVRDGVCVCECVLHRCAFFVSAYLSFDLRMHSVRQTELILAYTHALMHTHGSQRRHTGL